MKVMIFTENVFNNDKKLITHSIVNYNIRPELLKIIWVSYLA